MAGGTEGRCNASIRVSLKVYPPAVDLRTGTGGYMHDSPWEELAFWRQGEQAVAAPRGASVPARHTLHACTHQLSAEDQIHPSNLPLSPLAEVISLVEARTSEMGNCGFGAGGGAGGRAR